MGHHLTKHDGGGLQLLSICPARPRYTRGFLWDEGFHLVMVCRWNETLCMKIISSWVSTQDEHGWIPRIQARGDEAERFIGSEEDIAVRSDEGIPPSLIMPLKVLMSRAADSLEIQDFLIEQYPAIKLWFDWYEAYLKNPDLPCTFSFRGRTAWGFE